MLTRRHLINNYYLISDYNYPHSSKHDNAYEKLEFRCIADDTTPSEIGVVGMLSNWVVVSVKDVEGMVSETKIFIQYFHGILEEDIKLQSSFGIS